MINPRIAAAVGAVVLAAACAIPATAAPRTQAFAGWSATWATSQDAAIPVGPWSGSTMRMVVRTSLGGSQVRVDLGNPYVATPASFGAVTVGVQQNGGTTSSAPVPVTFGGSDSVTVPAGGSVTSDPVSFPAAAGTRLLVSLYVPTTAPISNAPVHQYSLESEFNALVDAAGDQYYPTSNGFGFTTFIDRLDVDTAAPSTVVAIGDSITAAMGTGGDTDTQWTTYLADRAAPAGYAVVNMGVTGDEVTQDLPGDPSVTTRWQHDVLDIPGAAAVIDAGGINDLRAGVSAAALEAAQSALAASAHAAGIRVLFTTITPCGGAGGNPCTSSFEAQRQAYNTWVRAGAGGAEDGFVDFDAAVGGYSSGGVGILNSAYDSGDHVHPNSGGNAVMANIVQIGEL